MARILLFTTPFCGYCRAAKNLLRAEGSKYEEIDVGAGRHVGGYGELAAIEREGKLNDWLANALKTFGSETLASDMLRPTALAGASET
jgi:glutaredoxin 3